jgi:hypothetical protein
MKLSSLLKTNQELRAENRNLALFVLAFLKRGRGREVFLPDELVAAASHQISLGKGYESLTPSELNKLISKPQALVEGAIVLELFTPDKVS